MNFTDADPNTIIGSGQDPNLNQNSLGPHWTTRVIAVTARADGYLRGLHQTGGGQQARHHLCSSPEASPHTPLLRSQEGNNDRAMVSDISRVRIRHLCLTDPEEYRYCRKNHDINHVLYVIIALHAHIIYLATRDLSSKLKSG